jgi:hypothetical protein
MNNYIYLDLNVFDRLEKLERLTPEEAEPYQLILNCLQNDVLKAVYSNAHIGDLIRAYKNSPSDTTALERHLQHIGDLTNNLCMCLYWKEVDVKVDERDIFQFFNSSLEDSNQTRTSFMGLFDSMQDDENPELNAAVENAKGILHAFGDLPITPELEKAFEYPLYQQMYPKTFETKNMASFLDDMMTLDERMSADPGLYRDLKRMMNPDNMNEFMKVLPEGQEFDKKEFKQTLKSIDLDAAMKEHTPQTKVSENPLYDELTSLYAQIDFKGFKSDKDFANMIDDGNHTFYAAHCLYFITEDLRCHYKAKEVYKQLNLGTQVFTPKEFLEFVKTHQTSSEEPV